MALPTAYLLIPPLRVRAPSPNVRRRRVTPVSPGRGSLEVADLDDESQYPAARCAMGLLVYLYFRSSSGVAESMNNANKEMRARTAVDLLNACISLLTKLEVKRYYK